MSIWEDTTRCSANISTCDPTIDRLRHLYMRNEILVRSMDKMRYMMTVHREAILYVFWGAFTTIVTLLSYMLFVQVLHIDPNYSNALSWVCGVVFAFVVNKWLVFESRSTDPRTILRELGFFFSSRIFTGVVAIILFPILNDVVGLGAIDINFGFLESILGTDGMISKIITSLVEIVLNWVFSKYVVFKSRQSSA